MARDGSGTFTFTASSVRPAVDGTDIEATPFNTMMAEAETGLSDSIAKDGQTTTTAVIPFASGIKTDTIAEKTSATGVTIDSVLCKDGSVTVGTSGQVSTDTIAEKTAATGVTIDGVLLKDSQVSTDVINEKTAATGVTIDGVLLKDSKVGASYLDIDGATALTAPATGDEVAVYDASATANRKITLSDLLKVLNSLTEDTTPDKAADFVLTYDTSASAVKKAKPENLSIFTKSFTSTDQTITSAGQLTLAHGLGVAPKLMQFELVCVTAEAGYTAGQVVMTYSPELGATSRGVVAVIDATNITLRYASDVSAFSIGNFSTGVAFALTNANWKLRVKAWA